MADPFSNSRSPPPAPLAPVALGGWWWLLWRWFTSPTVRAAMDLHRRLGLRLRDRRDLLDEATRATLRAALDALAAAWARGETAAALREQMRQTAAVADRCLPKPPWAAAREGAEMLLIALTVVLALRSFAVQPMQIPSGSMQPTLYGVTAEDMRFRDGFQPPVGLLARWRAWVRGESDYHIVARTPGLLEEIEPPQPLVPFLPGLPYLTKQRFRLGGTWYTVWFPPQDLPNPTPFNVPPDHLFFAHAGVNPRRRYRAGEDIINLRVIAGDHVLVDRFTYNFRRPRRGEIIVFETDGVLGLQPGTHYIKRLIGLGNEHIRIGNDRHVVVDGQRLDATTPHLAGVYSFAGPPRENQYAGHLNDWVARRNRVPRGALAPLFPDGSATFTVRPHHYLVLGDNTVNSYDSRRWGDLPQENVVGRLFMVYWPFSERFGWGQE